MDTWKRNGTWHITALVGFLALTLGFLSQSQMLCPSFSSRWKKKSIKQITSSACTIQLQTHNLHTRLLVESMWSPCGWGTSVTYIFRSFSLLNFAFLNKLKAREWGEGYTFMIMGIYFPSPLWKYPSYTQNNSLNMRIVLLVGEHTPMSQGGRGPINKYNYWCFNAHALCHS